MQICQKKVGEKVGKGRINGLTGVVLEMLINAPKKWNWNKTYHYRRNFVGTPQQKEKREEREKKSKINRKGEKTEKREEREKKERKKRE